MWSQELQHLLFSCLYWNTLCPNRQGVLLQTTACRRTSTKSSHTPPPLPPKVWFHHEGQHLWFTAITIDLNRNTVNDEKSFKTSRNSSLSSSNMVLLSAVHLYAQLVPSKHIFCQIITQWAFSQQIFERNESCFFFKNWIILILNINCSLKYFLHMGVFNYFKAADYLLSSVLTCTFSSFH